METIINRMDSLNTVMQEAAEAGNLASSDFVDLFEIMADLISELREVVA